MKIEWTSETSGTCTEGGKQKGGVQFADSFYEPADGMSE